MISNPCCWFSGGGSSEDQKRFTYEGGKYLYHFDGSGKEPTTVRTGWTGSIHSVNIVFFANDVDHARDVLRRMLEFRMECAIAQQAYYTDSDRAHAQEYCSNEDIIYQRCMEWLSKINEAVFTLAPTNQLYSVGWACNDTIL